MEKNFSLPQMLTAGDIQHFLKISKGKAYELFKEEGFPTIVIGKNKRVLKDDFLKWIESQKITSQQEG
ncbi:helix-turn-helix domain-containing protein [Bacillus testis]|uniref:helix-turn-helix domain-containing protein n=1 Tax=Bacillus testis TaxID=1622072 RepID=UPI00067ECBD6|nr:helix-turn-helix domain-containing protein [Bacillus testis]